MAGRWGFIAAFALAASQGLPALAQQDPAPNIIGARYADETDRYGHGILGQAGEYATLVLELDLCPGCDSPKRGSARIELPENRVFEDIAPRVVDLDGDGFNEVVVVETEINNGGQLAVYDMSGKVAATPDFGQPFRWMAPIGIADFDGDGYMDIAYIETPHLGKVLKIWRFKDKKLELFARKPGLTNHKIGQDFISGGVRYCGQGPEIITADAAWSKVMMTRYEGNDLVSTEIGKFKNPASLKAALKC